MAKIPYIKTRGAKAGVTPAISLTRRDPQLAALVTKVEQSRQPAAHDQNGNQRPSITNAHLVRSILSKRAKRNTDAAAIVKLFPDIELSIQILTSSILSPKDMTSVELNYAAPQGLLSAELTNGILSRLKRHFEDNYKIKNVVNEMLREPLFEKGAYPIAVIPENAIDAMINGDRQISTEALREFVTPDGSVRNLGILGAPGNGKSDKLGLVLESLQVNGFDVAEISNRLTYTDEALSLDGKDLIADWNGTALEEFVVISDNPALLRLPKINALAKKKVVHQAYQKGRNASFLTPATEGLNIPDAVVERAIYRTRHLRSEPVSELPHQNQLARKSVGNPLIMKLPSEAVLPVHVPGNPKHHVGYFVLLDEEGNPMESPDGDHMHPGLQRDQNNSVTTNLIKKVSMNMGINQDQFNPQNTQHVQFATRLYSEMVERDLISRVKNGVYSGNVTIAKNEEVYRLMLARVLSRKYSQLLYIPVEYMTYIAFKYSDDGIGRSLIDDQSMLHTIRSVLLFSDVIGSVKNSIGRTKVSMSLEPTDPNPMKTIEAAQDEIVRSRMVGMPMGVSSPVDITEYIQRQGYEWDFANHPGLPDLKFEFQNTNSQYQKADSDLQEGLRKATIMGFGLSPETVDNGFNAEFATTAVANNVLLSKRVITWQDQFTPQLTDHLRKVAMHSESVIEDIKDLLAADFDGINLKIDPEEIKDIEIDDEMQKKIIINRALHEFFDGFEVTLPRPTSVTLEGQLAELKDYAEALDTALDAYLASDLFAKSVTGDLTDQASTLKAMYKAYFLRKWMAEKNILSELSDLTAKDTDGKLLIDVTDEIVKFAQEMSASAVKAFTSLTANVAAVDKDLAVAGVAAGDGFGGGSSDTSTTDDSMGGFDMGGMGDFGGMGDLTGGIDDTAPSEDTSTPPAEEDEGGENAANKDKPLGF